MIVADTHVIIWDALNPQKLSPKAKKAIHKANNLNGIIFCSATAIVEKAKLVTSDKVLLKSKKVPTIW